ncbi:hypothetical protein [Pararhodobacter zhoushanensis]|uniref:Uncharacterized protein n=1 Tax=Pararhodobacter zhoushanensis TaxID=2479545 RepID=A0ABT3GTE1_9RHOB|nr:hypothetical protein [Pararhodobacter zhoushanensis]MCW1930811.1 hypothetical protein [Pararhodobacter zhoushanensis]
MPHEWMFRTLENLQNYARLHGMEKLVEHLDQGRLLAELEIANQGPVPPREHLH